MPWDPAIYDQFKNIRYQPFLDLVDLIDSAALDNAVDIGCGTGEQTSLLSKKFENTSFLGIDSSPEMLAASKKFEHEKLVFKNSTIEEFADEDSKWGLIFSNAALQWSDHHSELFPKIISKVAAGGHFAVQMPFQKENILNQILLELVQEQPFNNLLAGFRRESPVLSIDEYVKMLFDGGLTNLNIFLKVYPIIAENETDLYNFISGSALIPYMEKLDPAGQDLLKSIFLERIRNVFAPFPAIYSFKRVLLYGNRR